MKLRWKILAGLFALLGLFVVILSRSPGKAQRELEETRRSLRQQGFKIALDEFHLETSPEESARAAVLGTTTRAQLTNRERPGPIIMNSPPLMTPAGTGVAVVLWKVKNLGNYQRYDIWPEMRRALEENKARLEVQRNAAISGPIRFEPIGSKSPAALLPYLADLKGLQTALGFLTILNLHDGEKDEAWKNLLAVTCIATEYIPEPIEVSHRVRFSCVSIAYEVTWNGLQFNDWTEEQLAKLAQRWESVDFFNGLPDTAAYNRANYVTLCQLEREQPLSPFYQGRSIRNHGDIRTAWFALKGHLERVRYRRQGTFEHEKALLLYYREQELQLHRAVKTSTWSEMRQLPGVTNRVPFISRYPSVVQATMNSAQMAMTWHSQGRTLLGAAAEAETQRRLILTVLALKRFYAKSGSYPRSLQDLVPAFLKSVPFDFMDGQPLRYLSSKNHFVLYSVGLDCIDNGAKVTVARNSFPFDRQPNTDLVWPRPASAAEMEVVQQEEDRLLAAHIEKSKEMEAADHWERTARRQAEAENLLRARFHASTNDSLWQGRPLNDLLHNQQGSKTNRLELQQMLALHQVITGDEPELVTFELPVSFDALTNIGTLALYVDPSPIDELPNGCEAAQLECKRATNGNCQLIWNTIYESFGKHALQAALVLDEAIIVAPEDMRGPPLPFVVSNLCQFSVSSQTFDPRNGPTVAGKLPELNGKFSMEISSSSIGHIKTITGTTTNGILKAHWDLRDPHGTICTNKSFDTVFHITLPDSGRSQTLKGP